MFKKIETILGPELLQPGTTVVCYPIKGMAADEINLSDEENFTLYEVKAVRNEVVSMQVYEESSDENTAEHIIKFFWEMIDEGKWWARLSF